MWKRINSYFRYRFFKTYSFLKCDDAPEKLTNFTIYLVDDWSIVFKCPCGCNNNIHLNTLSEASPSWSYKIKSKKVNISPSINRVKGCGSHFWVRKGKIYWC